MQDAASTMYTALCRAGEARGLLLIPGMDGFAEYLAWPRRLSNIEAMKAAMKAMKAMKKKLQETLGA